MVELNELVSITVSVVLRCLRSADSISLNNIVDFVERTVFHVGVEGFSIVKDYGGVD